MSLSVPQLFEFPLLRILCLDLYPIFINWVFLQSSFLSYFYILDICLKLFFFFFKCEVRILVSRCQGDESAVKSTQCSAGDWSQESVWFQAPLLESHN